jgi:hypothetical protein
MIEEPFTDEERVALLHLAIEKLVRASAGPLPRETLVNLIRKIGGCDTVVLVRRTHPSRATS